MSSVCADQEEVGDDPFASDEFRMYEFKVRRCVRSRSHDWTECPFAHPGEKARRRDPRRFHYSGTACADFRRAGGSCPRGDACEFAHGVFECWLHPARYRTHACKDGKRCKRKVCFFAHSPQELRVFLPFSTTTTSSCCCSSCVFCGSPTSTLSSRTFSPPPSPTSANYNLLSRFNEETKNVKLPQLMSYKSALMELARSLKAMEITTTYGRKQFVLSSSTGINKGCSGGPREMFSADHQDAVMGNNGGGQFPDLEWVNELVM